MNQDFHMSQGQLLANVADRQMRTGICFALSGEWCICARKARNFNIQTEFFRLVARHRAYKLTWAEQIRNYTAGNQYATFFQLAEPPSFVFFKDQARHEQIVATKEVVAPVGIAARLEALAIPGNAFILGFFGVNNGKNWGHATAWGWRTIAGALPRFFDPNLGQYSWSSATSAATMAAKVLHKIDQVYTASTIRDYVIYTT